METAKFTKRMLNFQKAAFENSYVGLTAFSDYSENMLDGFLRQFPWVSDENRKPIYESIDMMKKACEDYKKMVDQGFEKLEEMASSDE